MEIFWCFGEKHCLHFQGMDFSFSEDWITTFSGKPVILYHWTLRHLSVPRSASLHVRCSLRKKRDQPLKTTLALPSDCDVVLLLTYLSDFHKIWYGIFYQICWARVSFMETGSGEVIFHISWAILMTFSEGNIYIVLWMRSEFHENNFSEVTVTEREYSVAQMSTKY